MIRHRIKVTLLLLGVVLGYGSAAFHFTRGHHRQAHDSCWTDW